METAREARHGAGRLAWNKWLARQARMGGAGGAAHRFVKRVEEDPDVVLRCGGARTATAQDTVNSDWQAWNLIWTRLQEHASAPWRTDDVELRALPRITAALLRWAALTFKEMTGIGIDGTYPRQVAWLSDELLTSPGSSSWRWEVQEYGPRP